MDEQPTYDQLERTLREVLGRVGTFDTAFVVGNPADLARWRAVLDATPAAPAGDEMDEAQDLTKEQVLEMWENATPVEDDGMLRPKPTRYQCLPDECFDPDYDGGVSSIDAITVQWRGRDRWCVSRGANWEPLSVWNGTGWEYEPLNSERTDEFLERCRFPLAEALKIAYRLANEP